MGYLHGVILVILASYLAMRYNPEHPKQPGVYAWLMCMGTVLLVYITIAASLGFRAEETRATWTFTFILAGIVAVMIPLLEVLRTRIIRYQKRG